MVKFRGVLVIQVLESDADVLAQFGEACTATGAGISLHSISQIHQRFLIIRNGFLETIEPFTGRLIASSYSCIDHRKGFTAEVIFDECSEGMGFLASVFAGLGKALSSGER